MEKDLEDAILRDIEAFLLEFGAGFTFVARQKRITVDGDDYYLDLLLFHRGLRRLVAVELKLGDFKPAPKGQMELYLRWLAKYELQPGESLPIGLILCAGKKQETIELLELEQSHICVAVYLLELPPKEALARKLHAAIQRARAPRLTGCGRRSQEHGRLVTVISLLGYQIDKKLSLGVQATKGVPSPLVIFG